MKNVHVAKKNKNCFRVQDMWKTPSVPQKYLIYITLLLYLNIVPTRAPRYGRYLLSGGDNFPTYLFHDSAKSDGDSIPLASFISCLNARCLDCHRSNLGNSNAKTSNITETTRIATVIQYPAPALLRNWFLIRTRMYSEISAVNAGAPG